MAGHRGLTGYVASTALVALAAVAWSLPHVDARQAAIVCVAVLTAEVFASTFREEVTASLSSIVALVAIIIGGPQLAIVGALGALPVFLVRASDRRVLRASFNSGQYAISAGAGGGAYLLITTTTGAAFPDLVTLLAVLAAAVTHCVVNHALVAGVIAVSTPDRFRDTFHTIGPSLAMQVPYAGIAILTVVVVERASWWALALMAVPSLTARYGLLAFHELDRATDTMVRSFVKAIEIKDLYTRGHSERVAALSVHVAEEMQIPYEQRRLTRYAALLHDVGKIGVPLCIINKPGPLDDDEFAQMKLHPTIGAEILRDIDFLEPAIDIVRYHHERLDGRGYPHGVGSEDLTPVVRIVTAVDAFDAMTSTRSYRRALTVDAALAELHRCTTSQFDPDVVAALEARVRRLGWEPTVEFASEAELGGAEVPESRAGESAALQADERARTTETRYPLGPVDEPRGRG